MRKALAVGLTSARERLRYPGEALGTAFFFATLLFIFSRLWSAVLDEGGKAGGYSLEQLLWYLVVTELVTMSPANVHQRIAESVRSGDIAVHLLKPMGYVSWELARVSGAAAVRLGVLTLAGAPCAALLVGWPGASIRDWRGPALALGVFVPAAIVFESSVRILIGLLAFWVEDSNPCYWIWQKAAFILGGLMLPLDLYPDWLARVASWLPFQALLYAPARTAVAFDGAFAARAALTLLVWGCVLIGALHLVSWRAQRRIALNGG